MRASLAAYFLLLSGGRAGAVQDFQMWKSPCLWPLREPGSPLKAFFCSSHVHSLIIRSFTLHRRRLQAGLGGADVQPSNKKLPGLFFACLFWLVVSLSSHSRSRCSSAAHAGTSAAAQFTE